MCYHESHRYKKEEKEERQRMNPAVQEHGYDTSHRHQEPTRLSPRLGLASIDFLADRTRRVVPKRNSVACTLNGQGGCLNTAKITRNASVI
jgi:hypothetical protein